MKKENSTHLIHPVNIYRYNFPVKITCTKLRNQITFQTHKHHKTEKEKVNYSCRHKTVPNYASILERAQKYSK
jgi:hypothetical protein